MLRCPGELRELLMLLVDPAGPDVDLERLAELLRADPAARRYYRQYMELHARLELMHDAPLPMPELEFSLTPDMTSSTAAGDHWGNVEDRCQLPALPTHSPRQRPSRWPQRISTAAAAVGGVCALVAFACVSWIVWRSNLAVQEAARGNTGELAAPQLDSESVGQIKRLNDCKWRAEALSLHAGLNAGDIVALRSGSVEIKMANGVDVVVEGPATFRVETVGSGYLQQGRISCRAPEGVDGFTVLTPSARVIDFGTEFGVWVDDDGVTEAHVLSGMVGFQSGQDAADDEVDEAHFISSREGARLARGPDAAVELINFNYDFPRLIPASYSIVAHHSGGLLRSNTKGVLFGSSLQTGTRRIGSSSLSDLGLANVLLFRLPPLERPGHIESARLEWTYKFKDGNPEFSVDLYGLGYLSTVPRSENWFFEGVHDRSLRSDYGTGSGSRRVDRLAQGVLTPETEPGRISVESKQLARYLQSLYDDGAQQNALAVFRLNADTSTESIVRKTGYTVVHAPAVFGKATPKELPVLHLRILQSREARVKVSAVPAAPLVPQG